MAQQPAGLGRGRRRSRGQLSHDGGSGGGGFGGRDGGPGGRGNGSAFSLGNIDDLVGTIVIGVGAMGAVILIDKALRRRRPVRPAVVGPVLLPAARGVSRSANPIEQ